MEMAHPLFSVDISKLSYVELADWIESCRNEVNNFEHGSTQYIDAVCEFCSAWEQHYEINREQYSSEKYKKAMLYTRFRNQAALEIEYGKGKEQVPYSEYRNMMSKPSSVFKSRRIEEALRCSWVNTYEDILKIFKPENEEDYKRYLDAVVSSQVFSNIEVQVRAYKDGKKISAMTYDEFLRDCEDERNYVVETEVRKKKRSYNKALEAFGVTSTLYHEFMNCNQCEKDFDKKFFVNLCFALALPLSYAEQLLNYNGFSLKRSKRQFDIICEKAFRIGFSRDMTIALIEKKNRELAQSKTKYLPIPNLTKNR